MPETLKPHLIPRYLVDSSTIKSIGYERRVLVIEFMTGALYAYPEFTSDDFEAFCAAESKGRYFNQQIKGKFSGQKLTGQCPSCSSAPEIIGELCADCGVGIAVAIEKRYREERYDGEDRTTRELAEFRKAEE